MSTCRKSFSGSGQNGTEMGKRVKVERASKWAKAGINKGKSC